MTQFIFSFLFLFSSIWMDDFQAAKAKAIEQNQNILLNFSGSDWCIPCIKMRKEIFDDTAFLSYADHHLILINADFPQTRKNKQTQEKKKANEALAELYNTNGVFPLTLLINSKGEVIKKWEGYHNEGLTSFMQSLKAFDIHGK